LGHLLPSSTVKKMTLKEAAVATRLSSRALQAAFPGFNEQRFVANISEAGLFWEKVAVSGKHSADGSVTGREPCLQYTRKPAVYATDLFYPSDVLPSSADGLSRSPDDPMFPWQAPRLVPSSRLASLRIPNHFGMAQACTTYEGITSNMLYRGSLGTMFRWHVEDSMLPLVSYCQLGKPKVWWVVLAHQRTLVKALLLKYIDPFVLTAADRNIWDVLASKRLFFPPKVFLEHGVQVTRAKRHAGDFIVTATGALHSGMNLGIKLTSATNFPTPSWWRLGIEHGACARELGRHVPYPLEKMIIQPSQQLVAGNRWWGDANILKACDPENVFMDVKEAEKFVSECVDRMSALVNSRDGKVSVVPFSGVSEAVRKFLWMARTPPSTESNDMRVDHSRDGALCKDCNAFCWAAAIVCPTCLEYFGKRAQEEAPLSCWRCVSCTYDEWHREEIGNNTFVVVQGSHEPLVVSRLCGEAGKQLVRGLRRLLQRVA